MGSLVLGVLGPVKAEIDGVEVDLGGPAPRTALAVLLAARGRVVTAERLADDLWDGDPPTSATVTLHGYISRLRRALEPDRPPRTPSTVLLRQGPGYLVPKDAGTVDAELFAADAAEGARLLAAGDPAGALQRLEQALALWRGPAYADCADAEFAVPEITRLDGLRLAAREDRLAALLDARGPGAAVPELEAFTAEQPVRERGWELLALALYRSGRQADALAALRTARQTLSEEYGLDPGPSLQRVEAAVLAQDTSLDAPEKVAPAVAAQAAAQAVDAGPRSVPEAPAPATGPSTNLPRPLSTFVGRQPQLVTLAELLADQRLVTLVGTGGTGKTRLALEAAARVEPGDGPWFVDLSGLHEADLLVETVAGVLGVSAGAGGAQALAATLRGRRILILLDNCEHVVDAAADFVATVLTTCPDVRVLATSREPLGVPGETVFDVPPLDLETEALELFRQRAAAQVPGWEPSAGELATVRHICAELDGIPLALELAAGQCRVLSVEQVAGHLRDRFALLQGGARTGNLRHRTLETAIDWSYSTLDEATRRLFGRLAVFEGGFDLDAAAAVGGVESPLRGVSTLVTKSLLKVEPGTDPRRYRMLESLRQYGVARLSAEERADAERCHREWLVALAESADLVLRSPASASWLQRLELEMPNARAALSRSLAAGDAVTAQRISGALAWFWFRRGHVAEGMRWLTTALSAGGADEPAAARAHLGLGILSYLAGDLQSGFRHGDAARQQAASGGDDETVAVATTFSSYFYAYAGQVAEAQAAVEEGLALAREVGKPWRVAEALMIKGQVLRSAGDAAGALAVLDAAVGEAAACGHDWAQLSAVWIGGKVALDLDDPVEAAVRGQTMAVALDAAGDQTSWLVALHLLAGALGFLDRAEEGAVLLGAVDAIGAQVGFLPSVMDPLDSPRHVEAVRSRLSVAAYDEATARGSDLSRSQVMRFVTGVELPDVGDVRREAVG